MASNCLHRNNGVVGELYANRTIVAGISLSICITLANRTLLDTGCVFLNGSLKIKNITVTDDFDTVKCSAYNQAGHTYHTMYIGLCL